LKYSDRLKACELPTFHYRPIIGDMTEIYKKLSGKYDMVAVPNLTTSTILTTRGNDLRLQCTCCSIDATEEPSESSSCPKLGRLVNYGDTQ